MKCFTNPLISVVFRTLGGPKTVSMGGPTTATSTGGGSVGVLSTWGRDDVPSLLCPASAFLI